MDPKMYYFTCFVLIVSVKGISSENVPNVTTSLTTTSYINVSTTKILSNSSTPTNQQATSTSISTRKSITTSSAKENQPNTHTDCLLNIKNHKELALWLMIVLLLVICFLLLVIIMCLACKHCQGTRNDEMVMTKSSKITRNNSVNGVPCETDLMYSSVRVEIETTPDESEESKLVGGAAAEVGNEVSNEENKKSANDTDETAPTQEVDQSGATDLKMEELEKSE